MNCALRLDDVFFPDALKIDIYFVFVKYLLDFLVLASENLPYENEIYVWPNLCIN